MEVREDAAVLTVDDAGVDVTVALIGVSIKSAELEDVLFGTSVEEMEKLDDSVGFMLEINISEATGVEATTLVAES